MSLLPSSTFAAPGISFFGAGGGAPVTPDLDLTGNLTVDGTTLFNTVSASKLDVNLNGNKSNLLMNYPDSPRFDSAPFEILSDQAESNLTTRFTQDALGQPTTGSTIIRMLAAGVFDIGAEEAGFSGGSLTVDDVSGAFAKLIPKGTNISTSTSVTIGPVLYQGTRVSYSPVGPPTNNVYLFPSPFKTGTLPTVVGLAQQDTTGIALVVNSTSTTDLQWVANITDLSGNPATGTTAITYIAFGEAP